MNWIFPKYEVYDKDAMYPQLITSSGGGCCYIKELCRYNMVQNAQLVYIG